MNVAKTKERVLERKQSEIIAYAPPEFADLA